MLAIFQCRRAPHTHLNGSVFEKSWGRTLIGLAWIAGLPFGPIMCPGAWYILNGTAWANCLSSWINQPWTKRAWGRNRLGIDPGSGYPIASASTPTMFPSCGPQTHKVFWRRLKFESYWAMIIQELKPNALVVQKRSNNIWSEKEKSLKKR